MMMPKRKKINIPEPDFKQRTVGVFYLDNKGKTKSCNYHSFMEPTETYKKRIKNRLKSVSEKEE